MKKNLTLLLLLLLSTSSFADLVDLNVSTYETVSETLKNVEKVVFDPTTDQRVELLRNLIVECKKKYSRCEPQFADTKTQYKFCRHETVWGGSSPFDQIIYCWVHGEKDVPRSAADIKNEKCERLARYLVWEQHDRFAVDYLMHLSAKHMCNL